MVVEVSKGGVKMLRRDLIVRECDIILISFG